MPPRRAAQGPEHRLETGEGGRQPTPTTNLTVDLPAGGRLNLLTPEEVTMWNESRDRYIRDFHLTKTNDLMLLGAILSQALVMYRAQQDLSDEKKSVSAQAQIIRAAEEIRKGETALGLDRRTREKGGQQTVADYVTRLKRAGHAKGVRISERTKAYERICNEAKWKIRILRNHDAEDRAYHKLTPENVLAWLESELLKIEEEEKKWAKQQAAIWVGRL